LDSILRTTVCERQRQCRACRPDGARSIPVRSGGRPGAQCRAPHGTGCGRPRV